MEKTKTDSGCGCGCNTAPSIPTENLISIAETMPSSPPTYSDNEPCCGPPAGPPASPYEKPGYKILHFVEEFITTKIGPVPRVKTKLSIKDHIHSALTRSSIGRNDYKVAPGLYCTGTPDENSKILVTANYKLSFDHLRKELTGINTWILVLDTCGINVWCAAGKGTFGTAELVHRLKLTGIDKLVNHKSIIVPQLGATGVSAKQTKKETGFKVTWGPVHTKDLVQFLQNDMKAEIHMRRVTFTMPERMILIPVELALVIKPAFIVFAVLLILSGIGPWVYSFSEAWQRGIPAVLTLISGIIAGAAITPTFLPQLPGTQFSLKGLYAGVIISLPTALIFGYKTGFSGVTALVLIAAATSSYLAMNFTGTTPFTSPSGVEKEMRKSIPFQAGAALSGMVLWIVSAF